MFVYLYAVFLVIDRFIYWGKKFPQKELSWQQGTCVIYDPKQPANFQSLHDHPEMVIFNVINLMVFSIIMFETINLLLFK